MNNIEILDKIKKIQLFFKEKNVHFLSQPILIQLNELNQKPCELVQNNPKFIIHINYKKCEKGLILSIQYQSAIQINCQICNQLMDEKLKVNTQLYLTNSPQNTNQKNLEHIIINQNYTLKNILRDEIYLNIPQYPRHKNCNILKLIGNSSSNPFENIKHLITQNNHGCSKK